MLNLLRGHGRRGVFLSVRIPFLFTAVRQAMTGSSVWLRVGVKIFNQPLRVQRHVARWCSIACLTLLANSHGNIQKVGRTVIYFISFFFILYSKLTLLWIHNESILLSIFIGKTAKQLKRIFVNIMLQSEIFERLLEEAEQMHIKRKEATEMLKVQ